MNAILLAAGYGKRLSPITKKTPKCLVKIGQKKLLGIWINKLISLGVKKILINTHYLSEQVIDFINKSKHKNKIKTFHEKKLLGTAQTVFRNRKFFDKKDSLIIHADNFCLDNLKKLVFVHNKRPKNCCMTMMTFLCSEPKLYGIVDIDENGIVKKMYEKSKNPPNNIANTAIYVVSKQFWKDLKKIEKIKTLKNFSTDIIPFFLGSIFTYQTKKPFFDIGSLKYFKKANKLLKK